MVDWPQMIKRIGLLTLVMLSGLAACASPAALKTTPTAQLPAEITLYDWADDISQTTLDAFTRETGVQVRLLPYATQEEVVQKLEAGEALDVVVVDNRFIPALIEKNLLYRLNHQNLSNYRNISPNFRDLTYDPGNQYSIPFSWGTAGIVYRRDRVKEPFNRWQDLWKQEDAGLVGLSRTSPREVIGLALKSLGYSANSENPAELEAALQHLLELKGRFVFYETLDPEAGTMPGFLVDDRIVAGLGFTGDAVEGRTKSDQIAYLLPKEGGLMWGDNFVISARCASPAAAELLINFLLRPQISGGYTNSVHYPTANEAALAWVKDEVLKDTVIYPSNDSLQQLEILFPLSASGDRQYADLWDRFLKGVGENVP